MLQYTLYSHKLANGDSFELRFSAGVVSRVSSTAAL